MIGDLPLLCSPERVLSDLGIRDPQAEDLARSSAEVVSSLIRSYTRLTITKVDDAVAYLTGSASRCLQLGERPVRAVSSITLNGEALTVTEYRWRRSGALWRDSGWGRKSDEIAVAYSHGFDRIPSDLAAVARTAMTRAFVNPGQWRSMRDEAWSDKQGATYRVAEPSGFTLSELAVLNRYRRRWS